MTPKVGASRVHSLYGAAAVGIVFVAAKLPGVFTLQILLMDEGLRLSGARFLARGLLPYRDYYTPYGPGRDLLGAPLHWLGLDSVLANRLLFFALGLLAACLVTYVVTRRRGLLAGGFMGLLSAAFLFHDGRYGEHHTLALVLALLAVLVLEEFRLTRWSRPLTTVGDRSADRAVLQAGILLGLAAWSRYEFGLLVLFWLVLVLMREAGTPLRERFRRWMVIPVGVAAFPYVVIAALGGLAHMIDVVAYALNGYGEYRSFSAPHGRLDLVRDLFGSGSIDPEVLMVALSSTAVLAIPLLILDRVLARFTRWVPTFESDPSRTHSLLTALAILVWYTTRVRADVYHLTQLVIPVWLVLVWSPLRWRAVSHLVGWSVALATIVSTGFLGISGWSEVPDVVRRDALVSSFDDVAIEPNREAQLSELRRVWIADGSPSEVFVANRSNELTAANEVIVYEVLRADPASWLTGFDPGFADQTRHQTEMIEDLCESGAPVILGETPTVQALEGLAFSKDLDRFLALNYDLVERIGIYDYRVSNRSGCRRLEAIVIAGDLDERLGELREATDEDYVAVLEQWRRELAAQ